MSSDSSAITSSLSIEVVRSDQDWRDDLIVVCIWLVLATYALFMNCLTIVGISSSLAMRTFTSYWFIISLCVCDIGMMFISVVHVIPATAFHDAYVKFGSMWDHLSMFFYDLFWYAEVVLLGVMAVNRLTSVVFPIHYTIWFSAKPTAFLLILSYSLGILAAIPALLPCCHTLWDSYNYIAVYAEPDTWYRYVDLGINTITLTVMVISYTYILFKVRGINRTSRQEGGLTLNYSKQCAKKELALFAQFFASSLVYLLTWTTWQWLPSISASKWIHFAMSSLFAVNNSINPTIYLLFNTNLRRHIRELLCPKHHVVVSSVQIFSLKPRSNVKHAPYSISWSAANSHPLKPTVEWRSDHRP